MDRRPLGKSGVQVSEIGLSLEWGPAAEEIVPRAAELGCTLFWIEGDPEPVRKFVGGVDAGLWVGHQSSAREAVLSRLGAGDSICGRALQKKEDLGEGDPGVFGHIRYNLVRQEPSMELMPALRRCGAGVVVSDILGGEEASEKYKFLIQSERTFSQAATMFALANEYVSCAIAHVRSRQEAEEILAAPSTATPLTIRDLENIFETWSGRCEGP